MKNKWLGGKNRRTDSLMHQWVNFTLGCVCVSQWWALRTVTRVTVRQRSSPWLLMATDGNTVVFRYLSSMSLSCTHAHTQPPWWDTISTDPYLVLSLSFSPALTCSPDNYRCVYECVCAAILYNYVSVFSLGVCQLPPSDQPICVGLQSCCRTLSCLSCLLTCLLWCMMLAPCTEAKNNTAEKDSDVFQLKEYSPKLEFTLYWF